MKIYTKGGDQGETGLYGGERVSKDHLRIRAYGTLDELNAALGVILSDPSLASECQVRLIRIQGELFQLGAELATPRSKKGTVKLIENKEVEQLEKEIDLMEHHLKPLKNFILPGGSSVGAFLHLARTINRRAERELVVLHRAEPLRSVILQYINRLSDYLFVCARFENNRLKKGESIWTSSKLS
jgi:cob(I)alamin adenosyltransferase